MSKISTGRDGEQIAAAYLKKNGYCICETNFRCPLGEIDIIAREKKEIVFIEVKTRKSNKLGYPEQAVGAKNRQSSLNWLYGICKRINWPMPMPVLMWWRLHFIPKEMKFD